VKWYPTTTLRGVTTQQTSTWKCYCCSSIIVLFKTKREQNRMHYNWQSVSHLWLWNIWTRTE